MLAYYLFSIAMILMKSKKITPRPITITAKRGNKQINMLYWIDEYLNTESPIFNHSDPAVRHSWIRQMCTVKSAGANVLYVCSLTSCGRALHNLFICFI